MAFIRAREIETELKNRGAERGTLYCLQVLAEQQIALQKDTRELAGLLDQMTNILQGVTMMGEQMKSALESLNSDTPDDGMGHNTHNLGND